MTLVMNRAWDAILKEPEPPEACYLQPPFKQISGCHILRSIWHWARGMAFAANGDVSTAGKEYGAMKTQIGEIARLGPTGWGNNDAIAVLAVAQSMLQARMAWAIPGKDSIQEAICQLREAVKHEGELKYDEPPQWFAPAREALGGAYLRTGNFLLARKAFEDDLLRHPKSGRALYGLMRALQGLHEPYEEVEKAFNAAWTNADYTMTEEDLWPAREIDSPLPGEIICPVK
jgi:tetratricopeptide (TPR) repeat protein